MFNFFALQFPLHSCLNSFNRSNFVPSLIMEKIRNVANSAFIELSAALILNLSFEVVFGFSILPRSSNLLSDLCAKALLCIVTLKAFKLWKACFSPTKEEGVSQFPYSLFTFVETSCQKLARLSIVNTATLKLSHYTHELGHAAAAISCYIKADPSITVRWYEGLTEYNISYGLTSFGEFLGEHHALLFVTSAGLIAPVICAMSEFAIAHYIRKKNPLICQLLNYHGVSQILNLVLYGYQSLETSKMMLRNDFIFLWQMGDIHPLFPMSLMIAVPLCELIALKYLEYRSTI
jgi:hypothetical protein